MAGLGGCAATSPSASNAHPAPAAASAETIAQPQPANPAPWISVPPVSSGAWYDLGAYRAPWLANDGPVPVAAPNAFTRVVGWRREAVPDDQNSTGGNADDRDADDWLAIVIVQIAPGASASCAPQTSILDVADGDPGCLRLRRNADFDHWMQTAQPALYRWVDEHGWNSQPRAWVAYRLPSTRNGALEVHALIAPSLIEPVTRNTTDFLTSGLPGQQWARQLAAAARATADAANGVLVMPPFPFAPAPRAEPEATLSDAPPASAQSPAATAPAVAEQVTPGAPARNPAPRQDRE
jgi:hypothetical protein